MWHIFACLQRHMNELEQPLMGLLIGSDMPSSHCQVQRQSTGCLGLANHTREHTSHFLFIDSLFILALQHALLPSSTLLLLKSKKFGQIKVPLGLQYHIQTLFNRDLTPNYIYRIFGKRCVFLMSWLLYKSQQIFIAFQFFPGVMYFLLTGQIVKINSWSFTGVGCGISRQDVGNFKNPDFCWLSREWTWAVQNLSLNCIKYHPQVPSTALRSFSLSWGIYTHDLGRVK